MKSKRYATEGKATQVILITAAVIAVFSVFEGLSGLRGEPAGQLAISSLILLLLIFNQFHNAKVGQLREELEQVKASVERGAPPARAAIGSSMSGKDKQAETDRLYAEAMSGIRDYRASGVMIYWQKAMDRLTAAGMDMRHAGPEDAGMILEILTDMAGRQPPKESRGIAPLCRVLDPQTPYSQR
jgi:hypothetical protein